MRPDPLGFLATELDNLRHQGLYRTLRILEGRQEATSRFDGKQVVNLSSNNYLGLAGDMRLRRAAADAALELGAGAGAVRPIIGNLAIHDALDDDLTTR